MIYKPMKLVAFALLLAITVSSCKLMVTKDHLVLSKGAPLSLFKKEGVDYDKNFQLTKISSDRKAKYEIFITKIAGPGFDEVYYYAFKDDALIYWGYPYMFTRHNSDEIRDIAAEAYEFTKKEYDLNYDKEVK